MTINGHKLAGIFQNLARHLDSVENLQSGVDYIFCLLQLALGSLVWGPFECGLKSESWT